MSFIRSEKIPYDSLPEEVRGYFASLGKSSKEWMLLSAEEQYKVIGNYSNAATELHLQKAEKKAEKKEEAEAELLTGYKHTDNLVLLYLNGDVRTENYTHFTSGLGFFGKAAVQALLCHVARGRQKEADAMLSRNKAEMLLETGRVMDYAETEETQSEPKQFRTLEGTAYRIALGAFDVKYHVDETCMAEMLVNHFKRLPHGEVERKKQYDAQFPKGWEEYERQRAKEDSNALQKVFEVLKAQPKEMEYADLKKTCEPALKKFRKYLDDQIKGKGKVFKTGFHFGMWPLDEKAKEEDMIFGVLGKALKLFVDHFREFGGSWGSPKNKLLADEIIGEHILSFAPANLAQAICMTLWDYLNGTEKNLERSLEFRYAQGYCFFRSLASANLKYAGAGPRWCLVGVDGALQNLCQTKTATLQLYAAQPAIDPVRNNVAAP